MSYVSDLRVRQTSVKPHTKAYPSPEKWGGTLIRKLIQALDAQKFARIPSSIHSHILIAVSGGADSMALAQLLIRYGRRVVDPKNLVLIHVNHGWRGKASDKDEAFVKQFAKKSGVKFLSKKLPLPKKGESPENDARTKRYAYFQKLLTQKAYKNAVIFTAHHQDDQIETLLWRLFSGNFLHLSEGIKAMHSRIYRPLLNIKKSEILEFLREEKLKFHSDASNLDPAYLRNSLRLQLIPKIQKLFPQFGQHLLELSSQITQLKSSRLDLNAQDLEELRTKLHKRGIHPRKPHWEMIKKLASRSTGSIDITQGWRVTRESNVWRIVKSPNLPRKQPNS